MKNVRGLVLAGGGAKGAYEAGVIKALEELNIKFDIVTGTSVGALNGLLYAQQDLDILDHLWDTLDMSKIMAVPVNFEVSMDAVISQKNLIKPFFKSYINEKGADITPFIKLLKTMYHPDKARNSGIDYGIVTVAFPSLEPKEITIKDMGDHILDYAIASASCFPAFPVYDIDGNGYIDGGYFDNVPISLAFSMGASELVVVELKPEALHHEYCNRPNIKFIRPYNYIGAFLDFSPELLKMRKIQGYYDTLKAYDKLKGYQYNFKYEDFSEDFLHEFYMHILQYETNYNHSTIAKLSSISMPITDNLLSKTYKNELSLEDYAILGLENCLKFIHYDEHQLYSINDIHHKLHKELFDDVIKINFKNITKDSLLKLYDKKIKNLTKDDLLEIRHREVIYYFYTSLKDKHTLDYANIMNSLLDEFVAALYIYCFEKVH